MTAKISKIFSLILLFSIYFEGISQETIKPISIQDLMNLKSVDNPQISPDLKWIAFATSEMNLKKEEIAG